MCSVFLGPINPISHDPHKEGKDNVPLLDESCHRVKHLIDVRGILGRCFQEGDVERVGEFLLSEAQHLVSRIPAGG